jgi:hypothetical protein
MPASPLRARDTLNNLIFGQVALMQLSAGVKGRFGTLGRAEKAAAAA